MIEYSYSMKFIRKNLFNIFFAITLLAIVFVPDAKAYLLRGLMEVGIFSPNIEKPKQLAADIKGIKFQDIDGKIVDLGDLKGKVIFLNFWATWCPPCRAEMPSINKLYQRYKKDPHIVFIFADADGDLKKSVKFMQNRKYEFPVFQASSKIPEQIFAGALPTTVVFDKQGRLSLHHEGIANYADKKIADFLDQLIASD